MTNTDNNGLTEGRLGDRMAMGAVWVVLMRFSIRSLGVLSTVILARLLTPADYGLIALATMLAAAVELLSSFNFEVWLLRNTDAERADYDTVWTLSIIRGLITAVLIWVIAEPIASFFDDQRLSDVIRVIAIASLVLSFANVGIIEFQKELNFRKDFILNALVKVGAFIVTVSLGVLWRNYWALAAGIVSNHLLYVLLSYLMHEYRPRLALRRWRPAFDFSKWLLAGSILSFLHTRADVFILGKLGGNQMLGIYNVSREIASLATSELVMPIRRVMLPAYAMLQDDIDALRSSFVNGFGIIMLVGTPCAVGLSAVADPLIRVLLGPQWIEAIPLMQALGIYGVSMIGLANQWPTLVALNKPYIATALLFIGLAILLPALYFATQLYGAIGSALALGLTNTIVFMAGLIAVHHAIHFQWRTLWNRVWRTLAATTLMAITVLQFQSLASSGDMHIAVTLVGSIMIGAVTYAAVLCFFWIIARPTDSPEQMVVQFLRSKLSRPASS